MSGRPITTGHYEQTDARMCNAIQSHRISDLPPKANSWPRARLFRCGHFLRTGQMVCERFGCVCVCVCAFSVGRWGVRNITPFNPPGTYIHSRNHDNPGDFSAMLRRHQPHELCDRVTNAKLSLLMMPMMLMMMLTTSRRQRRQRDRYTQTDNTTYNLNTNAPHRAPFYTDFSAKTTKRAPCNSIFYRHTFAHHRHRQHSLLLLLLLAARILLVLQRAPVHGLVCVCVCGTPRSSLLYGKTEKHHLAIYLSLAAIVLQHTSDFSNRATARPFERSEHKEGSTDARLFLLEFSCISCLKSFATSRQNHFCTVGTPLYIL